MLRRSTGLSLIVATSVGAALFAFSGCTSILGDFDVTENVTGTEGGTEEASSPGPDATVGCPEVQTQCGAFLCDGPKCRTSCTDDKECLSPATCQCPPNGPCTNKVCAGTKANATQCAGNGECASGFCVDGVCCNTACSGQCQACDVTPGTCSTVGAGQPHGSRTACTNAGMPCGGTCDGASPTTCTYPTTKCSNKCKSVGVETDFFCDGKGACSATGTDVACTSGFACRDSACLKACVTANSDCQPNFTCTNGQCQCGALSQACCNGSVCNAGSCSAGTCENCGGLNEVCCQAPSAKCANVNNTVCHSTNKCVSCGTAGTPCCSTVPPCGNGGPTVACGSSGLCAGNCGHAGTVCCEQGAACVDANLVCNVAGGKICSPCGSIGNLCCFPNSCPISGTCKANGYCSN